MTAWLTRIQPDPRHQAARRDLSDGVRLHQRVMKLFPDGLGEQARQQAGVLFRAEPTPTGMQILVQSRLQPGLARLPAGYGVTDVRNLDPLLQALDKGVVVHYRIAANTSKRMGRTAPNAGKVVALSGQDAERWWADRADRHGLSLRTLTANTSGDITGWRHEHDTSDDPRRDSPRRVTHATTRFDGTAVVTDPDALRAAVLEGIGRGKSHGCGLLSLALASRP